MALKGIQAYSEAIQNLQAKVLEQNEEVFELVAAEMVSVMKKKNRIFTFGTGHSGIIMEESFCRAGGLAASVPIFMNALMLHENTDLAGKLERTPEIAAPLLEQMRPREGEMMFIFTNSGVNGLPIQMALEAQKYGLTTVGVCSREYALQAPLSRIGKRLDEVADYSIDNCGVPGDALIEVEGFPWRTAPSSTVIGAFIWNCLVTECVFRLQEAGEEIPVFISGNYLGAKEGGNQHNQHLIKQWAADNPFLPYIYR
ncbi:MAG: sugar isomerase domain-containing protein [Anaerolineales bacterium]|nr:sugar isomerase domain-containing protein [Anaerolineales bacterium]